jgi:hypothetical protein
MKSRIYWCRKKWLNWFVFLKLIFRYGKGRKKRNEKNQKKKKISLYIIDFYLIK